MNEQFANELMESFSKSLNGIIDSLINGIDYVTFQEKLRFELNNIGIQACEKVLEMIDQQFLDHKDNRPDWYVQRKNDVKRVLTPFGEVSYRRTYFRNKRTGEYAYLADRIAGYEAHQRVDISLKADFIEEVTERSYRKSGCVPDKWAANTAVTGQTVMNTIREFNFEQANKVAEAKSKRKIRTLYIEADEDHVHGQNGKSFEVKLAYVHEGKEQVGKRFKLKNAHYFTCGKTNSVNEFWQRIWQYIDATYETKNIENIFISGDGASWIRSGCDYIPLSHFVLDKFHIQKSIRSAVGVDNQIYWKLMSAVKNCEKKVTMALLEQAKQEADSESHAKRVLDCKRYLQRNWDGIKAYKDYNGLVLGCSAEGHVSHILSARLSSRPIGWTVIGADQIANLRALKQNGVSVRDEYIAQASKRSADIVLPVAKITCCQKESANTAFRERISNMPYLNSKGTLFSRVLRSVANGV